jgi:hypothetical protein
MTMTSMRDATLVCLAIALAVPAGAEHSVNERRPALPTGQVSIEDATGTLTITGWDKAEVAVTGTLGAGAEGLSVKTVGERTVIAFDLAHKPQAEAELEINLPAGSDLEIEGFSADTSISGVKGDVRVETVNGDIRVTGAGGELELHAVNGAIETDGTSSRVQAEAVNGAVTLRGPSGAVQASTVNGPLRLEGGRVTRAELESVAGEVHVQVELADGGRLDVQTVSGSVDLALPANVSAMFDISTFSGDIANDFGAQATSDNRFTTQKSLSFKAGSGSAHVEVETLSGAVKVRKR